MNSQPDRNGQPDAASLSGPYPSLFLEDHADFFFLWPGGAVYRYFAPGFAPRRQSSPSEMASSGCEDDRDQEAGHRPNQTALIFVKCYATLHLWYILMGDVDSLLWLGDTCPNFRPANTATTTRIASRVPLTSRMSTTLDEDAQVVRKSVGLRRVDDTSMNGLSTLDGEGATIGRGFPIEGIPTFVDPYKARQWALEHMAGAFRVMARKG
ncbi:Class II Aldolase family protein [Colletotrichum lupini]|uniref:Class II Aldolase family protein n=1 Tax=Colletotrichum lupini TaxID=145971 RepID=A0A9Q8SGD6_9PEZI|nr:Class II Aldolase family protein [Colletotrichum lupini]UQC76710.1 Class II Aldolase family protein [Colletotrichum lupini]